MKKYLSKYFLLPFLVFVSLFSYSFLVAQNSSEEDSSFKKEIENYIPSYETTDEIFISINLPATQLEFYVNKKIYKTYPIAIGMGKYPTPIQQFNISQIIWNPWWLPPDSDWAKDAEKTPPGPNNPLGPVKMLMENGIRIHGTNKPRSIGHAASHACIRMYSKDAKDLAWEIQKRYSEKNKENFLENYSKKRDQSFYVVLKQEVPVNIVYKQAILNNEKLILYPDFYRKGGFQKDLEDALSGHINISIDSQLVQKLSKMRRKGAVEIDLNDLSALQTGVNEIQRVTIK